jgi:hypothetical protein
MRRGRRGHPLHSPWPCSTPRNDGLCARAHAGRAHRVRARARARARPGHPPACGSRWETYPPFRSTLAYFPTHHITAAVLSNESDLTAATLNIPQVMIQTAEHH